MRNEDFNLKIKQLSLKNFRGFDNLDIEFDEKLTVIIADNGGGKTTVLDCIAALLRYIVHSIEYQPVVEPFSNDDIMFEKEKLECKLSFSETLEEFELSATYTKNKLSTKYYADGIKEKQFPGNEIEYLPLEKVLSELQENEQQNLPIIAYYPCQLASVSEKDNGRLDIRNRFATYEHSLDNEVMNFNVLRKWFVRQSIMEFNGETDNPIFKVIKEAIVGENGILNDPNERRYTDLKIGMKNDHDGNFLVTKGKTALYDFQLSSGEKSLLLLVANLARRVAIATPNSRDPLKEATGVVLIDEIDLHLHPHWQRNVVTKIQAIFPNIQFIITAHSPLILNNIYSKHIRVINKGQVYGVKDTFGHDDADDMLEVMGVKSETKQKIKEIHRLLRDNKIAEAKTIRNNIITEGTFAPLLEIDLFIQRKEKMLHEAH